MADHTYMVIRTDGSTESVSGVLVNMIDGKAFFAAEETVHASTSENGNEQVEWANQVEVDLSNVHAISIRD